MTASSASRRRWAAGPVCSWPSWCRTRPPNVLNRSMIRKLTRARGKGHWVSLALPRARGGRLALAHLLLLLHHTHRPGLGDNAAPPPLRPGLGELGAEQQNHRRVVDPDQHDRERAGGPERLPGIAAAEIEADKVFPDDKQKCRYRGADPYVAPGHRSVGEHLENRGEQRGHDRERDHLIDDLQQRGGNALRQHAAQRGAECREGGT